MKKIFMLIFTLLPLICFAADGTGDTTFHEITDLVTGYLTGSLGSVFVVIGFLGAGAAIAGFASMKVMFPIFGLAILLRYGPKIIIKVFGATGELNNNFIHHLNKFSLIDLLVVMLATLIFIIGYVKYKNNRKLINE